MEREALKLALEALGKAKRQIVHAKVAPHGCIGDAITAIKEALAQPEQEPVAWMKASDTEWSMSFFEEDGYVPLYTTPPQRTWVEPTGNEWFEWWRVSQVANETEAEIDFADFLIIAQAVAAKLKEENT